MSDDFLQDERNYAYDAANSALVALDHDSPLEDVKDSWDRLIRAANAMRGVYDALTERDGAPTGEASSYLSHVKSFQEAVQHLSDFANGL